MSIYIYLNPGPLGSTNYFALPARWQTTKSTPNLNSIDKKTPSDLAKAMKFAISWSVDTNYLELKWGKKLGSTAKVEQQAFKVRTIYNNRSPKYPLQLP